MQLPVVIRRFLLLAFAFASRHDVLPVVRVRNLFRVGGLVRVLVFSNANETRESQGDASIAANLP
jgi:hypothetical protein